MHDSSVKSLGPISMKLWHGQRKKAIKSLRRTPSYYTCRLLYLYSIRVNHAYQNQTCIDVMDVGVSAFSECFLFKKKNSLSPTQTSGENVQTTSIYTVQHVHK